MAPKKASKVKTADFRHRGEKRTNIPTAKLAGEGKIPQVPKARYAYDPHLPPVLRYDETGRADVITDRIDKLIDKAGSEPLSSEEQSEIREAVRHYQPWLEWAGKREQHDRGWFEVDPVALHIHERVSTQAILRAARREDLQRELFADPQLPYQEAVQFYRHDVDWTNRMILGDSLQVMSSLARREGLAGKVQMIYMDPPYGIRFASNFQPKVRESRVKESVADLSRELETVRAYRDAWTLGTHSYLSYLGERLAVVRELLVDSGSIFLQIGDENVHRARGLLDEVFGAHNFRALITARKTAGLGAHGLVSIADYVLWYAKNLDQLKTRDVFENQEFSNDPNYVWFMTNRGEKYREPLGGVEPSSNGDLFRHQIFLAAGRTPSCVFSLGFEGRTYEPTAGRSWSTNHAGCARLMGSNRLTRNGNQVNYVRFAADSPTIPLRNIWEDTGSGVGMRKMYAVQTTVKIVQRCVLLSTDPGDLVLDPTCGGGTTASVAEQWGRRWITIDTSRVAIAIARQRLLTDKFDHYKTVEKGTKNGYSNPGTGFVYKTVPHITLKSIAQNTHLDPIFEKHRPILEGKLAEANAALSETDDVLGERLAAKLRNKEKAEGKKSITDAERRRWLLPPRNRDRSAGAKEKATVDLGAPSWYEWEVPFDVDPDWPQALQQAVTDFRQAWRAKMDEVNACIEANAPQEELVDQPEVVKGVVRVSGPFTVEGVMPAELRLEEEGLFDGAPGELEYGQIADDSLAQEIAETSAAELQNVSSYLHRMVQLLRADGVTFPNNRHRRLARIEPLFEEASGSVIHAEGLWQGTDESEPNNVALGFGPQYGPVTAAQVEELIHASRRYDELVIAGFSFDGAATAIIQEQSHPRLTIHQAHIRPDINPAMDGLLKDPQEKRKRKKRKPAEEEVASATSSQQLFTVFGLPEIEVREAEGKGGPLVCELLGVDVYDPITGEVQSTGASKVAAWFLDSDYDGRCFCITQAFFPDQNAWEKIQKALKSSADPEAFEAFRGTVSLPFEAGKHRRIAVKVIDPRGNEVMTIRPIER